MEITIKGLIERRHLLAAAAVAMSIAAGCGGGTDSATSDSNGDGFVVEASTTMTASPDASKPRFVRHVNHVCRRAWPYILNHFAEYTGRVNRRLSKAQSFAKGVPAGYMSSVDILIFDRIHMMRAAPGEKEAVEELIGALQEGVERGQRLAPPRSPAQLEALFVEYNGLAARYGLYECLITGPHLPRVPGP